MGFTQKQVEALLKPINKKRVLQANGQSHVPAFDVAAHLTRIFGFGGWETENCEYRLAFEEFEMRKRDGREYRVWTVGYTASITLLVKDPQGNVIGRYSNGAGGDAVNQPTRGDAHHLAMTTAISTALKRCAAFGLGDQFGLSLYNKGMTDMLVGRTLVMPQGEDVQDGDVQEHSPIPVSLGNDEKQVVDESQSESQATTSKPVRKGTRASGNGVEETVDEKLMALITEIRQHAMFQKIPQAERGPWVNNVCGREVSSLRELTLEECCLLLEELDTNA